jgi:hypothetical protein
MEQCTAVMSIMVTYCDDKCKPVRYAYCGAAIGMQSTCRRSSIDNFCCLVLLEPRFVQTLPTAVPTQEIQHCSFFMLSIRFSRFTEAAKES